MEVALADINLKLIHILGENNIISDSLSRYYINDQHKEKKCHLVPQASWVVPADNTLLINYDI